MQKTNPVGAPTKYKPRYCKELINYFDVAPNKTRLIVTTGKNDYRKEEEVEVACDLPHVYQFAKKIGVTTSCLYGWAKKYPEFEEALKEAKQIRENIIETNALKGLYNATFSIFDAKNTLGWRDEQHLNVQGMNQIFNIVVPQNYKPKSAQNRLSTNTESQLLDHK